MNHATSRVLQLPLLGLLLATLAISTAQAQSDQELRQENQRLRTENEDLKRELEAAKTQLERLGREIEALRQGLQSGGGTGLGTGGAGTGSGRLPSLTPPPPPPVSIDESKPNASPRAMQKAIQESHDRAIDGVALGVEGDRDHTNYLRTVARWVAGANREFRTPVEWHVRIRSVQRLRNGFQMSLIAVDPKHHDTELGDTFTITLPANRARRLDDSSLHKVLVLKGTLMPAVQFNREREQPGPFNNPPLLGPFVEFGFTVEATGIFPAGESDTPAPDPDTP